VIGRMQPQFTATATVTVNILRAAFPTFSASTFTAVISRNTPPVSIATASIFSFYQSTLDTILLKEVRCIFIHNVSLLAWSKL